MKVKEAEQKIKTIENCVEAMGNRIKTDKEPYYSDAGKCTVKLLLEYKQMLIEKISNAELN